MTDALAATQFVWDALDSNKFVDEEALLEDLLKETPVSDDLRQAAMRRALDLVETARATGRRKGMMESFLEEFGLSNAEGLALMCLAEALLRVPDAETRRCPHRRTRSVAADWGAAPQGHSSNRRWSTPRPGALMLTGRRASRDDRADGITNRALNDVVRRPRARKRRACDARSGDAQAMRDHGRASSYSVRTCDRDAMHRGSRHGARRAMRRILSYDMLGEGGPHRG